MYINLIDLFWLAIGVLGIVGLAFLIICLIKLSNILTKVDTLLDENKKNLDQTLVNVKDITDNVKDISDVATEATADVIVAKESIQSHLDTVKDITNIVSSVFLKNK